MNVETGSATAEFLFWEYLLQIFGIVTLQWVMTVSHLEDSLYTDLMFVWLTEGNTFHQ